MVDYREFHRCLRRITEIRDLRIAVLLNMFVKLTEENVVFISRNISVRIIVFADIHHTAVLQLNHGITVEINKIGLVSYKYDQSFLGHCLQDVHDKDRVRLIEVAGWLVGQDDLRVLDDRPRDGNALLLSAGKGIRKSSRELLHSDVGKCSVHTLGDHILVRKTAQPKGISDIVEDRLPAVEVIVLENDTDVAVPESIKLLIGL